MFRAKRTLALTCLVALAILQNAGCYKVEPIDEIADSKISVNDLNVAKPAIRANSDFAGDLYQQLAKENPGQNLFFSPYSLSNALVISVEGARGETAAQMGAVLRFEDAIRQRVSDADMNPWNTDVILSGMSILNRRFSPKPVPQKLRDQIAALRETLQSANRQAEELRAADKNQEAFEVFRKAHQVAKQLNAILPHIDKCEIRVASALWGEQTYPFDPTYLEKIRKFYGKDLAFSVDFKHEAESARQQINNWVLDQTNERIQNAIPPMGVNETTRLVIANAIYFKSEWQEPFKEDLTKDDHFTIAGGTRVPVQMMHEFYKGDVQYAAFHSDGTFFTTPTEVPAKKQPDPATVYPEKNGFLMLELPYKGGDLSMIVILPQDVDGIKDLEKKISGEALQNWIGKLEHRAVQVYLPKFKLHTEYAMRSSLVAMGMSRAFDIPGSDSGAQFDGMCASQNPDHRLYISEVLHKAFVEVSEKGTEAAAATLILNTIADGEFEPPVMEQFIPIFRADKPFLFLIRDIKTRTILFLGRIVRPQE